MFARFILISKIKFLGGVSLNKKRLFSLFVVVALVFVLSACGSSGVNEEKKPVEQGSGGESSTFEWPEIISFGTPSQGSSGHVAATIIADLILTHTDVRQVTVEPYGNANAMVRPLNDGDIQFAFHGGYRAFTDAYYGEFGWEGDGHQNILSLMYMYVDPWGILVTVPDIKDFGDLRGKSITALTSNRDHLNIINAYLDIYNMTQDDIKILPVDNVNSAVEWLSNGQAVAFPFGAAPGLQEVKQTRGLWALPVPDEIANKILKAEPTRLKYTLPAGQTVISPEENTPFLGLPGGVAVNSDVDEELVYEIVKLIYEKGADKLFEAKPTDEKNWKPEHATAVFTFPVHDGLIKYLEEKGLWTEEQAKMQRDLMR